MKGLVNFSICVTQETENHFPMDSIATTNGYPIPSFPASTNTKSMFYITTVNPRKYCLNIFLRGNW